MQGKIAPMRSGPEPVLHSQPGYPKEFLLVVRYEDAIGGKGMSSDEHVIGSDRGTASFESQPDIPVIPIGIRRERKHLNHLQKFLDTFAECQGVLLDRSVAEFSGNDDARADTLTGGEDVNPGSDETFGIPDKIGKNVGAK